MREDEFRKGGSEILWNHHLNTFPVFQVHGWIEPGETIREQRLVPLHEKSLVALNVQLRIVSNGIEWNEATIIDATPELNNRTA